MIALKTEHNAVQDVRILLDDYLPAAAPVAGVFRVSISAVGDRNAVAEDESGFRYPIDRSHYGSIGPDTWNRGLVVRAYPRRQRELPTARRSISTRK